MIRQALRVPSSLACLKLSVAVLHFAAADMADRGTGLLTTLPFNGKRFSGVESGDDRIVGRQSKRQRLIQQPPPPAVLYACGLIFVKHKSISWA